MERFLKINAATGLFDSCVLITIHRQQQNDYQLTFIFYFHHHLFAGVRLMPLAVRKLVSPTIKHGVCDYTGCRPYEES
jgi:hypothetical protein